MWMKLSAGHERSGRFSVMVLVLVALAGWIALPMDAGAAPPAGSAVTEEWLDQMRSFFDSHPELKEQRGSGWKPFNRLLWMADQRRVRGELPPPGARWRTWRSIQESGTAFSKTSSSSWFCLGPANLSGRIVSIDFHPGDPAIVYAGAASGGLWKSTDGGETWATTTDQLPSLAVGAVKVLPWDPDVILIGTGEGAFAFPGLFGVGVLRSTDAGATWDTTSLSYPLGSIHGFHVMEANPLTGTILAGATDGLWRSTDDGRTWAQVREGGNYYDVKWKPGSANVVYTAKGSSDGGNNVKVSTDDGITWAKSGTGQPVGLLVGKTRLGVSPADPNVVYANYTNSLSFSSLGVYKSSDNGSTWVAQNTSLNMVGVQGWYNLSLAVDPDDIDHLIAGGVELYVSTNGGVDWVTTGGGNLLGDETEVHVDVHSTVYEPGSTSTVWVGTDGGIWRSTDDGETWASRREGLITYQFYDICVAQSNPAFMMGGTQDNGLPGRVDVDTWFRSNLVADGMVCNISPTNADTIYAESQHGNHVKSVDGGESWFDIMNGITGSGVWVTPVDQDQSDPDHLYTATVLGVHKTTDGGGSWQKLAETSSMPEWISISPVDGDVVWAVYESRARYTTNDGDTWNDCVVWPFSTGMPTKILAHPTDLASALVTFSGYEEGAHVAKTTDYGATWVDVSGNLPRMPVNAVVVDPLDPNAWYIGTDLGVWWSIDGGANWFVCETGMPNAIALDLELQRSARKLVAGTYGRGVWEVDIPAATSVAAGPADASSLHLMLDPPTPNPVDDIALLRFAARQSGGDVTLDVYDIRGRHVANLLADAFADGIVRNMYWSTNDLSPGVYFLLLRSGEFRKARRMVVAH